MEKLEALERETAAVRASLGGPTIMAKNKSAVVQHSQFSKARDMEPDPLDSFIFSQAKNANNKKRNLTSSSMV